MAPVASRDALRKVERRDIINDRGVERAQVGRILVEDAEIVLLAGGIGKARLKRFFRGLRAGRSASARVWITGIDLVVEADELAHDVPGRENTHDAEDFAGEEVNRRKALDGRIVGAAEQFDECAEDGRPKKDLQALTGGVRAVQQTEPDNHGDRAADGGQIDNGDKGKVEIMARKDSMPRRALPRVFDGSAKPRLLSASENRR
jgi:hypothetical protein